MTEKSLNRPYGLDFLESSLEAFEEAKGAKIAYNTLRIFLPYCLRKEGDLWIPLNRDYKPIGTRRGWYDYSKYNFIGIESKHVDSSFSEIDPLSKAPMIFFFTDATTPITSKRKRDFFKRVQKVFKKS